MLVPLGVHRDLIRPDGFSNDTLAEALGLGKWIDPKDEEFDAKAVRTRLRALHQQAEAECRGERISECLDNNIARLAELVGLSEVECRILEFVVMLNNERLLTDTAEWLGQLSSARVFHVLSLLLDIAEPDVRAALSGRGALAKSGLVSLDSGSHLMLSGKLDLLSDKFADHVISSDADPISLLRDTVAPVARAELKLSDYAHIDSSLAVLLPYLRKAHMSARKGVNVLLYGAPGTGKSQLAKALADKLGCDLFEVAAEDENGDPIDGEHRLRAFRAAQSFFRQQQAMILFDEVEDVFNDTSSVFGSKSTGQTHKAWINRILETNSVPTLWVSNSIDCLDAAFIRRFDMVVKLPVPPKRQRVAIIENACSGLIDTRTVDRLADSEVLAPAVVARAASVVLAIRQDLAAPDAAAALELLISNTLEAQGHKPIRSASTDRLPETYDPAFVHVDADLVAVTTALIRNRAGRLCLYGPPGTGKTAYGHWLAEQLGVPLHVKHASDLMSKWVGDNEKNIAAAFREAEQDGAMLLIDEVDSFLQDRRGARASWEVSLVNEMLTQMERFPGVFVASTNVMEQLDQAALRRFDAKIRFGYLKVEQAWMLFCRHCDALGFMKPSVDLKARVGRLDRVTPGDFATVVRWHRFSAIANTGEFLAAIEAECGLKEGGQRVVGFV
ncbi:AAA family ATPase [Paraburkholderia edwinii]|uniref:AAA family ATPase n=2 Tax=Paraburkholderia edwinii TaxID=2861782 RepID=A0ABX8UUS4_9BURK|nr:AAA family ATPase [Paraburkholderia edwinii]